MSRCLHMPSLYRVMLTIVSTPEAFQHGSVTWRQVSYFEKDPLCCASVRAVASVCNADFGMIFFSMIMLLFDGFAEETLTVQRLPG